jgi:uncharacterized protein (TIGR03435 family)
MMKRKSLHAFMERCLGRSRGASRAQVDLSETRNLQRLRQDPMWESDAPLFRASSSPTVASAFLGRRSSQSEGGRRKALPRWMPVAVATAVLIVVVGLVVLDVGSRRYVSAVVEAGTSSLYRVADGEVRLLRANERVTYGDVVRSNGGTGGMLRLNDGSRVEMRSQTELTVERPRDGVRIRLATGGIIVNAAQQRDGHLYVQTKDVTVSVVGTVFLVNAEEQGSRVAVIEGEVRVRQGTTDKTLLPGEQVATSPAMPPAVIKEEIAWSRNQSVLAALLRRSAAVAPAVAPQNQATPREAFEVVSIRPRPAPAGGPGRSGSPFVSGLPPACGGSLRIDPRLFRATNITVYELITIAYEKNCDFAEEAPEAEVGGLLGGPEWIRTVRYDIDARRPEDASDYTSRAYTSGTSQYTPGPKLRRMVQSMLADRFRLDLRREMKEMAVYELSVAPGGLKLPLHKESVGFSSYVGGAGLYEAIKNGINPRPEYNGLIVGAISATGATMSDLASQLTRLTGRPVLNRTGIEGTLTYEFFFAPAQWRSWRRNPTETRPHLMNPSLFTVLEEELGLRLVEARRPVEVVVIASIERPTDN